MLGLVHSESLSTRELKNAKDGTCDCVVYINLNKTISKLKLNSLKSHNYLVSKSCFS